MSLKDSIESVLSEQDVVVPGELPLPDQTKPRTIAAAATAASGALSDSQRMSILKALADPRRLEIVESLSKCSDRGACSELRELLPISAATLSHHLKELEAAGLISIEREGKFAKLTFRREIWQAFVAGLQQI